MDTDGALAAVVELGKQRGFDTLKGAKGTATDMVVQEVVDGLEDNVQGDLDDDVQGDLDDDVQGDLAQVQEGTKAQAVVSIWQRRASELMAQEIAPHLDRLQSRTTTQLRLQACNV